MTMIRKRDYSSELNIWKLIFALLIMVQHSELLYGGKQVYFEGGSIGVEFFFLTSGLLMARSAARRRELLGNAKPDLSKETWSFLRRKISAVYPYLIVAFLVSFAVILVVNRPDFETAVRSGIKSVTELLMINWSGMLTFAVNGPTWYLSVMLLSMAVLYPLILKYGKTFTSIACPLIAVFLLGYLQMKYGHFRTPAEKVGLFYKGMIRGFAELSLGVFCYEVLLWMRRFRFTAVSRVIFTLIAYGTLVAVILISNSKKPYDMDPPSVIFLAFSVIVVVENLSLLSGVWNRLPFTAWLGKFSMVLYLNHRYCARFLGKANNRLHLSQGKLLLVYIALSVVAALCCSFVVWLVRRWWRSRREKIRGVFLTDATGEDGQ